MYISSVLEMRDSLAIDLMGEVKNPGKFNLKKIQIKVTSHEVKKGGFFSSDFALFQVETEMPEQRERIKV